MTSSVAAQGVMEVRPETARKRVRILSLCSVFPHPLQQDLGRFVRARLLAMAEQADVKVVAPVAYLEYGNPVRHGLGIGKVPPRQTDGHLEVLRPRWQYLPNAGPVTAFLMAVQLVYLFARVRRSFHYDVIDSHFAFPEGIAAALLGGLFRCPYTITLRGNETEHDKYLWRGYAIRWAIRKAAHVITVSERLRKFAIECGADPLRTTTIPNGINADIYYPREGRGVLAKLSIPEGAPVILSAGYLIEGKGHHKVIQAMRTLASMGSPAHLIIAGGPGAGGRFAPVLRKLVGELRLKDRVHFTGNVVPDELAQLMSAADVFVLASRREGWPNVVNEALACGVPVVATDVGAVPEMLPSAEYGLVVPLNDQPKLEEAVSMALNRHWDRNRIAAWGASRSWNQVAAEVLQCLERAAGVRNPL
jgi:glycosyltransferase involved in cell wall biosynthesis